MKNTSKTRKLNYQDDAILFMKSLLRGGKRDVAMAIKKVLLEICREGIEYSNLVPSNEIKNMYRIHIPGVENDDTFLQGFRASMIVMQHHVLVTSIESEYS